MRLNAVNEGMRLNAVNEGMRLNDPVACGG